MICTSWLFKKQNCAEKIVENVKLVIKYSYIVEDKYENIIVYKLNFNSSS